MNSTELKTHFYKRFNGENGRLVFTQAGLPVSLIGNIDTDIMPSISCQLSMQVRIIGRKIGSNSITVTSTSSDMRRIYDLNSIDERDRISHFIRNAKNYNLKGGEFLLDSTIPSLFNPHITYTSAMCKAIFELSEKEIPSPMKCTKLCTLKNERGMYLTEFASEKGYCIYSFDNKFCKLPLPMTGYKFIVVAVKDTPGLLSVKNIQKTYDALKKLFPHITSFCDVTNEMLEIVSPILKSYSLKTCARHLVSECARTKEAAKCLRSCNLKGLSNIMNKSFLSQKHLCTDNDSRIFLCDELYLQNGVIGVRICEQGVIAIVEKNYCDNVINNIKYSYESEFGTSPFFCVADSL